MKANPCALNMNNHNDIFLATSNYLIKDISPSNIINYLNTSKENGQSPLVLAEPRRNAKSSTFSLLSSRDHLSDSTSINYAANPPLISSSLTSNPSPAVQLVRRGMQIFQHNQSISHQPNTQSQLSITNNGQQLGNAQANFFKLFNSSATYCKNKCKEISLNWFVETALSYQLAGKSIGDTFDHNAAVAERLGREQVAQTWRILKQLYVGSNASGHPSGQSSLKFNQSQSSSSVNANSSNANYSNPPNEIAEKQPLPDKMNDPKTRNNSGQQPQQSRHASGSAVSSSTIHENKFTTTRSRLATYSGQSNRPPLVSTTSFPLTLTQSNKSLTAGKNDSDADESDDQFIEPAQTTPLDKEFDREHQDFFFGDGDVNDTHGLTSYDVATNEMLTELDDTAINPSEVQREAFQLKHEIQDFTVPPDLDLINNDLNAINLADEIETFEDDLAGSPSNERNSRKLFKDNNVEKLLAVEVPANPPFKFTEIVVQMLSWYADQGDIQTTVSALIILGEKLKYAIDLALQEHWFHSYIDLLSKFQLWSVINQVANLSVLPSINSLNQLSTTIYTTCAGCNKPLNNNKCGWFCERCKKVTSKCSFCHEVVKGIYVWCKTCSHGGHLVCERFWFTKNKECPTGCGHLCEYN